MSEADITTMATLADGSTNYGPTIRGAWATLQTRLKPTDLASATVAGAVELATNAEMQTGTDTVRAATPAGVEARLLWSDPQSTITHTADGPVAINWATSNHWRVNSAGFDVTSITETNGAGAGRILSGTIEVINTHGSASLTVDTTGMDYGLDSTVTVVAGDRELIQIFSTL